MQAQSSMFASLFIHVTLLHSCYFTDSDFQLSFKFRACALSHLPNFLVLMVINYFKAKQDVTFFFFFFFLSTKISGIILKQVTLETIKKKQILSNKAELKMLLFIVKFFFVLTR